LPELDRKSSGAELLVRNSIDSEQRPLCLCEFHVLTFHEAISADPPLLTDYQVVVIGVTDGEAKAWAEQARLVRTADDLSTDASRPHRLGQGNEEVRPAETYEIDRLTTQASQSRRQLFPPSVSIKSIAPNFKSDRVD